MEESKRTATLISHLSSSIKKAKKKNKEKKGKGKIPPYDRMFVV